jgi:predicted GNAT family acetyltransferase
LPTRELAALIEASECLILRAFYDAARRLRPIAPFECLELAGGVATFMGKASPLSHATSIALDAPVSAEEISRITSFFRDRGAPSRISVNPLADPSLESELVRAGYVPRLRNNVLAIDASAATATRDNRIDEEPDLAAWGRASYGGFSNRYVTGDEGVFLATTIASSSGVIALSARNGEGIAATSAMLLHGNLASLIAGSTVDSHRGKGYHRAMIIDRVARAREAGARYARASSPIGSTSERNFRACGFEVLYTRVAWELA